MNQYEKILRHYGIYNQTRQLMEECAELAAAASHCLRSNGDPKDIKKLIEEFADVNVVFEQLKIAYNINSHAIDGMMRAKIERTNLRMKEETKHEAL